MEALNIRTSGNESQITINRLAQITVAEGVLTIDLHGPSQQIVQSESGSRLTIQLNERLAYVAPEARGEVAEELGLPPYQYKRES
jgi:hypothetical protein